MENQTRNLPTFNAMRQPTAPPRTSLTRYYLVKKGSAALSYSPPTITPIINFYREATGSSETFACLSDHMGLIHGTQ